MAAKKYRVQLSQKQLKKLKSLSLRGETKARKINRARILLLADENRKKGGLADAEISSILDVSQSTVVRVRQQFVTEGLDAALFEKPRCGRPTKFSGTQRAQVTALACSDPPQGRNKWTLRLIADQLVELDFVESISHETVGVILKKNELKPHLKKQWCIGKLTTEFLWHMEDVLSLYQLPYDPISPLITFDERPCQLIGDLIVPIPMKEGQPKKQDYQYERNGVCTVFCAFEPHTGQRIIEVRKQRTRTDYAFFLLKVASHYPQAEGIIVVQDHLNTHNPSSFYQTFEAQQAFELTQLFKMHYTPKHASWLNMVEIELSALSRQCLNRRIGDMATLEREVLAWTSDRNQKRITVNWQFSINDAREKFSRFYPNNQICQKGVA